MAMVKHRYQIIVDGYSASYDSSYWKLASNSTVLWYIPDNGTLPYWMLWWFADLEPNVHYIPAKKGGIVNAVHDCVARVDFCRSIAQRAASYMRTRATPVDALAYTSAVLQRLVM